MKMVGNAGFAGAMVSDFEVAGTGEGSGVCAWSGSITVAAVSTNGIKRFIEAPWLAFGVDETPKEKVYLAGAKL